jgi:hypothetical protein
MPPLGELAILHVAGGRPREPLDCGREIEYSSPYTFHGFRIAIIVVRSEGKLERRQPWARHYYNCRNHVRVGTHSSDDAVASAVAVDEAT